MSNSEINIPDSEILNNFENVELLNKIQSACNPIFLKEYAEGYSYKEISDLHKMPIGSIKFHIHKERQNIFQKFKRLD